MTLLNNVPDFNGRIITELKFGDLCLVAWGGLRIGGAVTVHMPRELMWNGGGGMAARAFCMGPRGQLCATWTYRFGFSEWEGATLCQRCFHWQKQKPKPSTKPPNGFWAYASTPKDENVFKQGHPTTPERRVAVVNKILAMVRYDEMVGDESDSPNRIVEV